MKTKAYDFELDLSAVGTDPMLIFDTEDFDTCSIQLAGNFGLTGEVAVKKTNDRNMPPEDIGSGVSTFGPGIIELTSSQWAPARYLVVECANPSTGRFVVQGALVFKKLGFGT